MEDEKPLQEYLYDQKFYGHLHQTGFHDRIIFSEEEDTSAQLFFNNMFSLQQGDEMCFSNPNQLLDPPEDLILQPHHASLLHGTIASTRNNVVSTTPTNKTKSQRLKSLSMDDNSEAFRDDQKKLMHRDIERQRRQEMAALHASLRSLLPIEFIKGKRAISDHMNAAVKYIKHLQMKIKELTDKRDELKELSNSGHFTASENGEVNHSSPTLMVQPCLGGAEIVLTNDGLRNSLPLSRVLQFLLDEGISVGGYVSTKVNRSVFHSVIQTEVDDPTCLNLSELQEKLTQLLISSRPRTKDD